MFEEVFFIKNNIKKVVLKAVIVSYEVVEPGTALSLHREPRSRQGFGRGKSITYGRLSPPLSAFNHTLCEQNIKTCPFVCRRRIVVDGVGRSGAERPARAAVDCRITRTLPRVYLEQSFRGALSKKYDFVLQCEEDWRPHPALLTLLYLLLSRPQLQIKSLLAV